MAVTQGLGDGFALYNGVELPNIDTVWTDELKKEYPYAYIRSCTADDIYSLYLSPDPLYKTSLTVRSLEDSILKYFELPFGFSDGQTWKNTSYSDYEIYMGPTRTIVWSSVDILNNNDSTTYLAATSPIPLDGMQVIEWDGDVTDLVSTTTPYAYKISDVVLTKDEMTNAVFAMTDGTDISAGALGEQSTITEGTGYIATSWIWSVSQANATQGGLTFPETGLYAINVSGAYVTLFAYTPAAEPETPKWQFNLQDFLSGAASAAASRGVLRREPIAYLYNGVQLPGLPEWDVGTYPYAWISKGQYSNQYTLHISTGLVNYRSWGDKGTLFYLYPISVPISVQQAYLSEDELDNGEWEFTWSKTYEENPVDSSSGFGLPIWSNFDVMNHYDSSTYLAASDPVPVYK